MREGELPEISWTERGTAIKRASAAIGGTGVYHFVTGGRRRYPERMRRIVGETDSVADLDRRGRPIGIEITTPGKASAAALNRVMLGYGLPGLASEDLRPLRAA